MKSNFLSTNSNFLFELLCLLNYYLFWLIDINPALYMANGLFSVFYLFIYLFFIWPSDGLLSFFFFFFEKYGTY
jgi:hypothetical protein